MPNCRRCQTNAGAQREINLEHQRQHGEDTEPAPQAIIISLPEEGNIYSFRRSVQVAENVPLELELQFNSQYKLRAWQWLMLAGLVGLLSAGLSRKTRET